MAGIQPESQSRSRGHKGRTQTHATLIPAEAGSLSQPPADKTLQQHRSVSGRTNTPPGGASRPPPPQLPSA